MKDESTVDSRPRTVVIHKNEQGYGFNVRGQVASGGTLKPIDGQLYAPMQHISAVLEDGPAHAADVKVGDRILEVNGVSAEGATHKQVVDMIRNSGDELTLVLISVKKQDAQMLEKEVERQHHASRDVFEKRPLPITIPDTRVVEQNGEKYTVFNIYLSGTHLTSRRYREFIALDIKLKDQFEKFEFPKLPGKWPFVLSETRLDSRRRALEIYLDKVCAARVIAEGDTMQEFLELDKTKNVSDEQNAAKEQESITVELRVLLADRSTVSVSVKKDSKTDVVYQAVAKKVGLPTENQKFFALFQLMAHDFERKLQPSEIPHSIYIKNYSSTAKTCLTMKKWLFSQTQEVLASEDKITQNLFYWQAVEDIGKGRVDPGSQVKHLQVLQQGHNKKLQFLDMARTLPDYCTITFPHAACDARKQGHVIASVSLNHLKLQACDEEGIVEDQNHTFPWEAIKNWEADIEEGAFTFQYARGERLKWVRIFTEHFEYMADCVNRVMEEIKWKDQAPVIPSAASSMRNGGQAVQGEDEKMDAKVKRSVARSKKKTMPAATKSHGDDEDL